jgi:hypothetical protein
MACWSNAKFRFAGLGIAAFGMSLMPLTSSADPPPYRMICTRETRDNCLTPAQIESLLVSKAARIVAAERTASGGSSAWVLTLSAPFEGGSIQFRAKWRPDSSRDGANSPRQELVAYALQRLYLDPLDYIHPPTRSRCFDLAHYRSVVDSEAQPSFPEQSSCVFGTIAHWVEGASTLTHTWFYREPVLDEERWKHDATLRRTLADANLLTYLTLNGDTHNGNWLRVDTARGQRVYMVDSSLSFTRHRNAALTLHDDFSVIVVPLRKQSVDRVMQIDEATLETLSAIERVFPEDGGLTSEWVEPGGPALSGERPYEFVKCPASLGCKTQMVMGMTRFERDMLLGELWHLQMRVEMGELALLAAETPP